MILLLHQDADPARVLLELKQRGLDGRVLRGQDEQAAAMAVTLSSDTPGDAALLADVPGVRQVLALDTAHPLVDKASDSVRVGNIEIGRGQPPVLIAGPCAVEDAEQIDAAAAVVAGAGGKLLRGGAFKPRTSPYSFQGLGVPGLALMREAADRHGLAVVTEAMTDSDLGAVAEYADMIQVGSRTMHAYGLLKSVGRIGKPVLLKRGMAATVKEWLLAAEYVLAHGASGVVLCERGIRTFESSTRNTLDLCAVAFLLENHRLPVIVDPSHAAGRRDVIPRLARAAIATGAHGLMIETHPDAASSKSDANQALAPDVFRALAAELFATR